MSKCVCRLLYRSLYRTCQRHDNNIPRSRHILWNTNDESMVASLRRSARKWTHITPATLSYGFASLRELRSYFDSSLRWHQVLKKYTEGEPIPIESGAIAIARVAHPYLDEEQVVQKNRYPFLDDKVYT